jgi:hypothetical protein
MLKQSGDELLEYISPPNLPVVNPGKVANLDE